MGEDSYHIRSHLKSLKQQLDLDKTGREELRHVEAIQKLPMERFDLIWDDLDRIPRLQVMGKYPKDMDKEKWTKRAGGPKEPKARKRKASSGKIKKEPEVKQETEKVEDKDAGETNPNKDIKDVIDTLDVTSV